ncbi:MAG: phosphoribosylamine--glycine ligase [Bacillota bacterium]|jgi:phosphoribosylamine--glycine ligase
MRVLVVGGGGREHALVWKIAQSPKVEKLYCAPGNAGIAKTAEIVDIAAEDVDKLADFVQENDIDLTVVGPEAPLAAGLSDKLTAIGKAVFGPSQAAAAVESSKEFAKDLMAKYNIPTAAYTVFTEAAPAIAYIKEQGAPIVVKADGLAAGKGVIVAMDEETAINAVQDMLEGGIFGNAGQRVVIEEFLSGEEVSILAFCDGETIVPMVSSQDHKRAYDGDTGPNTGGMGAYSPAPVYTPELAKLVEKEILLPSAQALVSENRYYQGVLYVGLMITDKGPKVLEYNARFGDPETQAVLMRLKTDLIDIIEAILSGKLNEINIEWYDDAAVCVVMAAGGYPGSYRKGDKINGLAEAAATGAMVFHAGTTFKDDDIVSNGGRVLGVTALGDDIAAAIKNAYKAVDMIEFADCFYRRDIGYRAIKKLN